MPKAIKKAPKKKKVPPCTSLVPVPQVDPHEYTKRDPDVLGRPTKYTGLNCPIVQRILEGLKNDFKIEEAFRYGGIGKTTFYRWLKENEEFAEAVESAKDFMFTAAKKNVHHAIVDEKDVKVSIQMLELRQRERYAKRQESLQNAFEPLTDEEEEEVRNALRNASA